MGKQCLRDNKNDWLIWQASIKFYNVLCIEYCYLLTNNPNILTTSCWHWWLLIWCFLYIYRVSSGKSRSGFGLKRFSVPKSHIGPFIRNNTVWGFDQFWIKWRTPPAFLGSVSYGSSMHKKRNDVDAPSPPKPLPTCTLQHQSILYSSFNVNHCQCDINMHENTQLKM